MISGVLVFNYEQAWTNGSLNRFTVTIPDDSSLWAGIIYNCTRYQIERTVNYLKLNEEIIIFKI